MDGLSLQLFSLLCVSTCFTDYIAVVVDCIPLVHLVNIKFGKSECNAEWRTFSSVIN